MARRLVTLAVVAAGWVLPASALAQTGASGAGFRRELVEQAVRARDAGNHALSLENALRAGQIEMTPSLRMLISEEQAALGQIVPAINNAELCERESTNAPNIRDRAGIISACHNLSTTLRARAARITVRVSSPAPADLRVTVAGETLPAAAIGVPYLVTPGAVHIEASAPGFLSFSRDVQAANASSQDVTVAMVRAPVVDVVRVRPSLAAPVVVTAVGGATLVASLALFLARNGAIARVESQCNGPQGLNCDPAARADFDAAVSLNIGSITTFAVGAALVLGGATGVVITALRPPALRTRAAALTAGVTPLREGALFTLHGAF